MVCSMGSVTLASDQRPGKAAETAEKLLNTALEAAGKS